jgi:hypothetical protein
MGEVCVLGVSQTGTVQVLLRWDMCLVLSDDPKICSD